MPGEASQCCSAGKERMDTKIRRLTPGAIICCRSYTPLCNSAMHPAPPTLSTSAQAVEMIFNLLFSLNVILMRRARLHGLCACCSTGRCRDPDVSRNDPLSECIHSGLFHRGMHHKALETILHTSGKYWRRGNGNNQLPKMFRR